MRVKLAALTIAMASLMLLPSGTKADTFEFDYTSGIDSFGGITGTVDLVFTITAPTLPTSGDVTSFTSTSDPFGTVTHFFWASSGVCDDGFSTIPAPCAGLDNNPPGGVGLAAQEDIFPADSFLSPGTYTVPVAGGAILVITDLSGAVPEPSSLLLLGCGLLCLLAMASLGARTRRFAS